MDLTCKILGNTATNSHNKHANGVSELVNKTSHKFSQWTVSFTPSQRHISLETSRTFFEIFKKPRVRAPSVVLQGLVDRVPPSPFIVGRFDVPNKSRVVEKETILTIDDAPIIEKELTDDTHQKGNSD